MTMTAPDKTTPAAPNPKPGHNPGYAEPQPRDKQDARDPDPRHKRNPDEGGMAREPEKTPGA
ncbi:MAG: hypothetical protein M3Q13_00420 [Pseudomonadota bacterium]|nr:hypothetical protein [Pseudomonadota bacterium]